MSELVKVSFNRWFKDVPLKELDYWTALRWYQGIELPIIEKNGEVKFHMPYSVTVLPHCKARIPTGMRHEDANDNWGHILFPIVNRGEEPIVLYKGELISAPEVSLERLGMDAARAMNNPKRSGYRC